MAAKTGPETVGAKVGDGSKSYAPSPSPAGEGSRYSHPDASGKRATGPEALGLEVGDGSRSYGGNHTRRSA